MDAQNPAAVRPLQARAERTRAALIDATAQIAAAEGEAAATTTRVARAAGVSVGAVYRYFADREALLLAAYDASVDAIVGECRSSLLALAPGTPLEDAARQLLRRYLEAATASEGHSELLRAMRRIRSIEADHGPNSDRIVTGLLAPFLARFGLQPADADERLLFLNVLMGTLVDLYLVTEGVETRRRLLDQIEAHMLLALERLEG